MTHYICTGACKGETDDPNVGTCQAETCDKFGQPLVACDCEDGTHGANAIDSDADDASE